MVTKWLDWDLFIFAAHSEQFNCIYIFRDNFDWRFVCVDGELEKTAFYDTFYVHVLFRL